MDNVSYPLLCRWGGKIVTQQGGVNYEGGHIRVLVIDYQMRFNELREKVCELTRIDHTLGDVKLLMRCPTYDTHVAIPMDDDHSLNAVWAFARRGPSLEIYVEQIRAQSSTQVYHSRESQSSTQVPTKLPTQLPTQVPTKLPTQVPSQLPNQVPTQLPTQWPTQLPTQVLTHSSRALEIGLGNGPHIAKGVVRVHESSQNKVDYRLIGQHYKDLLTKNLGLNVRKIIELVKKDFQCTVSYKKAWCAKQWGLELIFGSWEKSFEILPAFMQALQQSNPGTIVEWCHSPTINPSVKMFKRLFWAFKPCIDGFKHCRPLMTIDSSYLDGNYKGKLFIANGLDANNRILPLAFAVVESDNEESWSWFMKCIRTFVTKRTNLCVISDERPGIMKAMSDESVGWAPPLATHRLCIRHLTSKLVKEYKVMDLKSLFEHCASQCQHKKFVADFNQIGELTPEVHGYLSDIGLAKWSIYHDGGYRYGFKTTNMVQSFNHAFRGACCLPIPILVQLTFFNVNKWFDMIRNYTGDWLSKGYAYSACVTEKIEKNGQKAQHHQVETRDDQIGIYEVLTSCGSRSGKKGGHRQIVNLSQGTCTCNKLQIYKYPCSHLLAVCKTCSLAHNAFVDPFYSSLELHSTFTSTFHPIPHKFYWKPYKGPKIVADCKMKRDKGI